MTENSSSQQDKQQNTKTSDEDAIEEGFVGVTLCQELCLFPATQVVEVIACPDIVDIPLIKSWVTGIAAYQGGFIIVADLDAMLCKQKATQRKQGRIVIISHLGVRYGLQVSQVHGVHHLDNRAFQDEDSKSSPLSGYVSKTCQIKQKNWALFDLDKLCESVDFLDIAV